MTGEKTRPPEPEWMKGDVVQICDGLFTSRAMLTKVGWQLTNGQILPSEKISSGWEIGFVTVVSKVTGTGVNL